MMFQFYIHIKKLSQPILTCLNSIIETLKKDVKHVHKEHKDEVTDVGQTSVGVVIVKIEHISHLFLKFVLLTLNK